MDPVSAALGRVFASSAEDANRTRAALRARLLEHFGVAADPRAHRPWGNFRARPAPRPHIPQETQT